jgi:DNA-directed RNA polymerase subunit L
MNHYKVALTFAGETRTLVEKIAGILSNRYGKDSILYDKYHEAEFARPGEVKNRAECEHPKSAVYAARPLAACTTHALNRTVLRQ